MTPEERAEARRLVDEIDAPLTTMERQKSHVIRRLLDALDAADLRNADLKRKMEELRERTDTAERERDAYAKAKAVNDERFLTERDAALVRLAEVERERDEAWQESRTYAFKGGTSAAERDEARARLAEVERERDEAQQIAAKRIDEWVKGASQKLIDQRDTARARLALAEAVCEELKGSMPADIVGNEGARLLAMWREGAK